MTSESEYAKRAIIARIYEQIDLAWNRKYEEYLDFNGREPRPIDERSLTVISAFFIVSWGLVTWQGLPHMVPVIATTTIVTFASLRFKDFDLAYQQYCQRRAELKRLATAETSSALGAGAMRSFRESQPDLVYCDPDRDSRLVIWGKVFRRLWIENCVPLVAASRKSKPPISEHDRGREDRLISVPPPSEPDGRISRIRLSG